MNYPQVIANFLMDAVFPVRCLECGRLGLMYLCPKCLSSVELKKKFECIGCGCETFLGQTCPACADDFAVNRLFVVSHYHDQAVQKILKCLKYNFVPDAVEPLIILTRKYLKYLAHDRRLKFFDSNPLLVPVPLFKKRFNWRGFNQSEILAKKISEDFLMPFGPDILKRVRKAKPQAEIKERDLRLANISGQFICPDNSKIKGAKIILVDDVCTSGATLNECAKVLKANGAREVSALVIARG